MSAIDKLAAADAAMTAGPWGHGFWSGQCHKDHMHGGPPSCVYDYELLTGETWSDPHRLVSLSNQAKVAGNYDYEEGGIIEPVDAEGIVLLRNALPEIVAVLLAVQKNLDFSGHDTGCALYGTNLPDIACDCCWRETVLALTALDAKVVA